MSNNTTINNVTINNETPIERTYRGYMASGEYAPEDLEIYTPLSKISTGARGSHTLALQQLLLVEESHNRIDKGRKQLQSCVYVIANGLMEVRYLGGNARTAQREYDNALAQMSHIF